ncbi:hypothetical protein [Chitinophaga sp. RAB17]|uniref:hypothetical protein n=1 Tax=Chitinophaga sp. RAB17 TaxID=3233049 RepID=UPI003F90D51D
MLYRFTKRVIVDSYNNGFVNTGKHQLFSVYDGETMMGEFYYNAKMSFFYFGDTRMKIAPVGKRLFKDMSIIDDYTGKIAGNYEINQWIAIGHRESIWLNGMEYTFRKIKPELKYSMFKKHTWGQYRYRVTNGIDEMIYYFKLGFFWELGATTLDRPFEGTIEVSSDNKMVLFASFYFIGELLEEDFIRGD